MKSLKSTFRDKSAMLFIMEGMIYNPISQAMHALTLVLNLIDILSPFFTASLQLFFHDWENETFCVKCGLNADRMRTKSAIADFYGSSASVHQASHILSRHAKCNWSSLYSNTFN